MAENLASLVDRIEEFLADKNNKSWSTETLTECVRLALAEINQAAGASYTLDDLDEAAASTIPGEDLPALIQGAAAYAVRSRSLDRMEKASLGEGPQSGLEGWAEWAMAHFKDSLKEIKARAMQRAASAPHSVVSWEEEPEEW